MKTQAQLIESIQRFQESFWDRKSTDAASGGIYDENIFLPINFLRQPFTRPTVCPEDVNGDLVASEYEYSFAHRAVTCDDFMRILRSVARDSVAGSCLWLPRAVFRGIAGARAFRGVCG